MTKKSRRGFLTTCAMVGAIGLAGCSSTMEGGVENENIEYPPKTVSDGLWEGHEKSAIPFKRDGLTGTGAVRTYTNSRISEIVQERFAGQFSQPLLLGFAVNLQYQGVGSSLVTATNLHENIEPIILERMKKRGITDITELAEESYENDGRTDPNTEWDKGEAYAEYLASFPVPEMPVTFSLQEYGEQTLTFPRVDVPMRLLLFVRDLTAVGTDGTAYVLGGVYPESNYRNWASTTLVEKGASSISLRIDLNTGLNLQRARRELVEQFINRLLSEGL